MICPKCGQEIRLYQNHTCAESPPATPGTSGDLEDVASSIEADQVDRITALVEQLPAACTVCGRADETIRFAVFPYVVSVLFMSFRRQFAGVWCAQHRRRWQIFASSITASLGWWGIPYGFIWTPMALVKLVRGGIQPPEINDQLLGRIAAQKSAQGDNPGTIRVLEAQAAFSDDPEVVHELGRMRSRSLFSDPPVSKKNLLTSTLAVWIGAALLGAVIGILDYWITLLIGLNMSATYSILEAIFSWVPFLLMTFIGSVVLIWLLDWALQRCHTQNLIFSIFLGISTTALAIYSILQGTAMSDYLLYFLNSTGAIAALDRLIELAMILGMGGLLWLRYSLQSSLLADQIYLIMLAIVAIFYLVFAVISAKENVLLQRKVNPT
jgi:preprotein translocase subunit SecE